ncbi:MAG: hypothetical protein N2169_08120, partial [bacterium]|nr:hypothetical protein [bacterium]
MAKLKKQILGKISGKLGDIVFRNTGKTNYIASRPSKFKTPMDENSIERRNKFALCGKFTSLVLSIPELKYFWLQKTPKNKNIFNSLFSIFYPMINNQNIDETITITP